MAEAADQAHHDFWRPPLSGAEAAANSQGSANLERSATCLCGTEFIVSSLYCHACGTRRAVLNTGRTFEIPGGAELLSLAGRLGLNLAATIAFMLGLFCIAGAVSISLFFTVRTALDWQAVQMWRIEWLLAAIAAFAAGVLLKKQS
ncbi:MAG: hypothetical protein WAK29_20045 [Terriglobales bacterium]